MRESHLFLQIFVLRQLSVVVEPSSLVGQVEANVAATRHIQSFTDELDRFHDGQRGIDAQLHAVTGSAPTFFAVKKAVSLFATTRLQFCKSVDKSAET
jgi:hypothetical protein